MTQTVKTKAQLQLDEAIKRSIEIKKDILAKNKIVYKDVRGTTNGAKPGGANRVDGSQ